MKIPLNKKDLARQIPWLAELRPDILKVGGDFSISGTAAPVRMTGTTCAPTRSTKLGVIEFAGSERYRSLSAPQASIKRWRRASTSGRCAASIRTRGRRSNSASC
jgi:hypothetical protein